MEVHQKINRGAHSAREFASILNRERDRADRTGQEFSLVAFDVPTDHRKFAAARTLLEILIQRIRSTDDIGWLRDGRIAATLPHTKADAAWKFVDKIRQEHRENAPPPNCAVYTYPSSWITQDDDSPSQKTPRGEAFRSMQGFVSTGMQFAGLATADPVRPVEELRLVLLHDADRPPGAGHVAEARQPSVHDERGRRSVREERPSNVDLEALTALLDHLCRRQPIQIGMGPIAGVRLRDLEVEPVERLALTTFEPPARHHQELVRTLHG